VTSCNFGRKCITGISEERFVLGFPTSRAMLSTARPLLDQLPDTIPFNHQCNCYLCNHMRALSKIADSHAKIYNNDNAWLSGPLYGPIVWAQWQWKIG